VLEAKLSPLNIFPKDFCGNSADQRIFSMKNALDDGIRSHDAAIGYDRAFIYFCSASDPYIVPNYYGFIIPEQPSSGNALSTQIKDPATGRPLGGFGCIDTGSVGVPPRGGMIVARLIF
jgi:hypothetical protein